MTMERVCARSIRLSYRCRLVLTGFDTRTSGGHSRSRAAHRAQCAAPGPVRVQLVRCSLRRAQGPEPRPEIFGKELRLLPRGKVPAFGELVVVDEFGKRPL